MKPFKAKSKRKNGASQFSVRLASGLKSLLLAAMPYLISLSVLGVLFGSVIAYALNSTAFELREVRVLNFGTMTPRQAFEFCELKPGENLIALDLVGVQQVIKRKHPEFKEVIVKRVLPSRIDVLLKRRTPVAQVSYSRYVQVDRDLVLLPGSSPTPFKNLTILSGAPLPSEGLEVGATLRDGLTKKALKLAEIIKFSKVLKEHTLTKIDIGDPKNITLYVDQDIEIRIGSSHIMERLKVLKQTLSRLELDRSRVRYIDLRFDDVVVGPR